MPSTTFAKPYSTFLTLGFTIVSAAGLFTSSCSQPVDPCTSVFAAECNQPCTTDANCANGLYCGANLKCTADCVPEGGQCDGLCDGRGRCQSSTTGFGTNTSGFMSQAASTGTSQGCGDLSVELIPTTPTVILLVDQSGSMDASFPGPGGNRWSVLYDALMNPNTGIVKRLESNVRFGLALYTGTEQQCPSLKQVAIQLNGYDEIDALYSNETWSDETPTGDSIDAIVPQLVAFPEPGTKVIVLATDGEPDTCEEPNPQNGQAESILATQNAFKQGILTFIISVGDDVSASHQQDVANAGRGLPLDHSQGDAPFYPANDHQALVNAFNQIIQGVRSCVVTINGTIDPAKACEGTVYIDNVAIPCNDPNGWRLIGPDSLELTGAACQSIQEGQHSVTGTFPCDVLTPR